MKRLLAYLKPHKWVMTAATVLVLFIIVVELYRPIVIGDAIDDYINGYYAPYIEIKCSQFPSCVDFTGFNCIQNCVYCYYLSFFSKIALKHRPHYFHI